MRLGNSHPVKSACQAPALAPRPGLHWPPQLRALAQRYETDIVAISFDALAAPFAVNGYWRSTLYALLEGVSERLQISRDDIDGTLYPTPGGRTSLVT